MWVTRNKLGLTLWRNKPYRDSGIWNMQGEYSMCSLDDNLFPELTYNDNPIEVEIIQKR
jgi:hypothetical protein